MDRDQPRLPPELSDAPAAPPAVMIVVEDDLYARTLERSLARRGWRTTRALGATEALRLWSASGARAALVDLDDRLSALTLLSALQATSPGARAVVVTHDRTISHLSDKLRRRLGIEAIVTRPCRVDAVATALGAVRPSPRGAFASPGEAS